MNFFPARRCGMPRARKKRLPAKSAPDRSVDVKQTLTGYLKELHLPTFRESFEELARQAERETLSYEQYLLELAQRESLARRAKRIERQLRQSRLPLEKDLASF